MTESEERWPPDSNAGSESGLELTPLEPQPPLPYAPGPYADIPEDLRVPWGWIHIVVFFFFAFGSLMVITTGLVGYFAGARHMRISEVQTLLTTNTPLIMAQQLFFFGSVLVFLYVSISVLRQVPFWRTIGWRPFVTASSTIWFFLGCMLAIGVGFAGAKLQPKSPMPIQELFKDRTGTLLVMAFAVLIAPLVEETIFRGFLYPVFARSFGIPIGILLTGVLFGLLHGAQLAWTWGYVAMLTMVGVIFTFVRARTGTVYASYLCHLGYNFMLFLGTAIATKGFTNFKPPGI
jgi:membrane protease YdiL (CAAX protease family)